jgi:glycosyltransferase involved in cell wall biosynthesis
MKARAAIETFDPHLVHIATPDLLGFRTLAWAGAHDVPVVSSYHTHFPSYLGFYHAGVLKPALERYLTWFYVRCRHVYVPTRLLEDYARGLGLDRNIRRWGRGVDCLEFSPAWRSEVWRRRRGFRADNVVVTFVGRLVREKGLDVFAGVVERLLATGAPIRSMIVGDGPLRSMLQERLPETTFTGHLEGEDLARAYAGSDVFLFPSETEAFGNVIVEAMASALPVVATARSGSSCHVRAERTGLLAPPGDVETFSRQTLRLALDASLRDCMGRQGRGYAKTYDWTRTLDRMLSYYDELLDAPETQP